MTSPVDSGWPAGLPRDGVQPWESVDAAGHVVVGDRAANSITGSAEFVGGVDYFTQGGSTADAGGVLTIDSGSAGSGATSWAIYRVVLGGRTPGTLGADINLRNRSDGVASEYYIGLADYAANRWDWHGPFSDGQVRLGMGGGMLSNLGNAFVAVVAYDGADFDVVGIGIDAADDADTDPPPAPGAPTVTPVDGGLMLEWLPVIAGDLAGYNIYYSDAAFTDGQSAGVRRVNYIEGRTRHALSGLGEETFVRISAVDISGNESGVSPIASGVPLAGTAPQLEVTVDSAVGRRGDSFTLTASGADEYDFDLDGDGIYEITAEPIGTQVFGADGSGIIRPAVRGTSGTSVALGAVSLLVSSNSRPVARLYADPADGPAPLEVSFTSEGEDFDGTIDEYAWDLNGDGIYDETSPTDTLPPQVYQEGGQFNAKLRVTDDQGATDVDTVAILVRRLSGFDRHQLDFDAWSEYRIAAAMVDGHPAIAYFDTQGPNIQYRRAHDPDGLNWGVPVNFAQIPDLGDYPALAVIDGRPALAWWDTSNVNMKYTIASDAQGTVWANPVVQIAPTPSGTNYRIFLGEVAGTPAVVWCDGNNIHYRRATSPGGDTAGEWSDPVATIDSSGSADGPPALAIVDGNPAVAYYNNFTSKIHYKRALTPEGATLADWPAGPIEVTTAGAGPTRYCRMQEVNGNPAISFPDGNTGAMAFMRALDATGSSWPTETVDIGPFFGGTPVDNDMKLVNGLPVIVYQDPYPVISVWYSTALDSDGTQWSDPMPVNLDPSANAGEYVNLLVKDGRPMAIYRLAAIDGVEVARAHYE